MSSQPQRPAVHCTLAERIRQGRAWTAPQSVIVVRDVARQLGVWHAAGKLHRAVGPERIALAADGGAELLPAEGSCHLRKARFDPQLCPPELSQVADLEIPETLSAAATALAGVPGGCDPRRIDLYPLGTILWRLLTGLPVQSYLYDPTARCLAPASLQPILDGLLGFDTTRRIVDSAALVGALDDVLDGLAADEQAGVEGAAVAAAGSEAPTVAMEVGAGPRRLRQPATHALPFTQLGPYQVLKVIGRGGMGEVYEGYDETHPRRVALKVLPPELALQPKFVERFQAEAAATAQVCHPNVVEVYDAGQDGQQHYFAMQYVEGETLAQRLQRGPLPVADALAVIEQCLAGLQAAHARGLIHRDIKPANVLLEAGTGRVVLVDFGLARFIDRQAKITLTGVILGTVDYLSPEQIRGLGIDARTDLYSLGVLWYELLCGELPFQADTPTAIIFQHAYEPPRPLAEVRPDLPPPLVTIVQRLLATDPAGRYASAQAVLDDLQAYRQGRPLSPPPAPPAAEPLPAPPAAPPTRRPRRRPLAAWLAVGMLSAAGTAWLVLGASGRLPLVGTPRVASSAGSMSVLPSTAHPRLSPVDLLAAIAVQRDKLGGGWAREGRTLCSTAKSYSRLQIFSEAPDEYDVVVEARRESAAGMLGLVCSSAGRRFSVVVDANFNRQVMLSLVDGKPQILSDARTFVDNTLRRLVFSIRKTGVRLTCDDQPLAEWSGDMSRLTATDAHRAAPPGALVLYTQHPFRIERLELIPFSR